MSKTPSACFHFKKIQEIARCGFPCKHQRGGFLHYFFAENMQIALFVEEIKKINLHSQVSANILKIYGGSARCTDFDF